MKKLYANNDKTKFVLVDDDVYDIIQNMGLKFCIDKEGYFISTSHTIQLPGMTEKKRLYLHRFVYILKTGEESTLTVDHIDRNRANNQFENLRLATMQEQNRHQGKRKNNTSGSIGVSYYHQVNKYNNKKYENDYWLARIRIPNGKREFKLFPYTEAGKIAAAHWRDYKVKQYFGEFGIQNDSDE